MYERGLQALQRRDFAASADALRVVIERYPDEPLDMSKVGAVFGRFGLPAKLG